MTHKLTNKDAWLKLFATNDTALVAAITLCERFGPQNPELNDSQTEFIIDKKKWLYQSASDEFVSIVDGDEKMISVQEYNNEIYPQLNNASSFISCIDHAIQKSEGDAENQFKCIGWNEATKQLILKALSEYQEKIKMQIR